MSSLIVVLTKISLLSSLCRSRVAHMPPRQVVKRHQQPYMKRHIHVDIMSQYIIKLLFFKKTQKFKKNIFFVLGHNVLIFSFNCLFFSNIILNVISKTLFFLKKSTH